MRGDFGLGDRGGHRPGRVEHDGGDLGGQRRRGLFGLADDDAIAPHHLVVFDGFRKGRGNVDHDIALAEREVHVLQPLERGLELVDALLHRHVHRSQRPRRHRAGRRQPVAHLEALHGLGDGVVERTGRLVGGEVAGDDQPLAQEIVIGAGDTDREFCIRWNGRPTAAHGDVGIAQRRFLDPLRRAFVVDRLMRERERCGRARFRRGGGGGCRLGLRSMGRGALAGRRARQASAAGGATWPSTGVAAMVSAAAKIVILCMLFVLGRRRDGAEVGK